MACNIDITSYVGLTPPATPTIPSIIRVAGTAVDCPTDEVCVRVGCAQEYSPAHCSRVVNGRWTVDVPTAGLVCECESAVHSVSIQAWCNGLEGCYDETSGTLHCQSLCPQVTGINPPVVPPCVPPGPAQLMDVTLMAVYSGNVWGATFDWDYGDGTSEQNAGPAPTHKYSFPGNYTPTVTLKPTDPACPPSSATININVPPCTTTPTTTLAPGQTTTTTRAPTPTTTTTPTPADTTTSAPEQPTRPSCSCVGLIWAAVLALAAGLLLLATYQCFGAASPYLLAAAIGLIVLYGLLLGLYYLLGLLGICDTDDCAVAYIHVLVLAPLGVILGVLAFLFGGGIPTPWNPFGMCFFNGVWWIYGPISGFWGTVFAGCRLP